MKKKDSILREYAIHYLSMDRDRQINREVGSKMESRKRWYSRFLADRKIVIDQSSVRSL